MNSHWSQWREVELAYLRISWCGLIPGIRLLYPLSYTDILWEFLSQYSQPPLIYSHKVSVSDCSTPAFHRRRLIIASPRVWRFLRVRMASIHGFKPPSRLFNVSTITMAMNTGFEPVTSSVTGWRSSLNWANPPNKIIGSADVAHLRGSFLI